MSIPLVGRNIVILPDEQTMAEAIRQSEECASRFPANFVLNRIDKLPHMTLHQFALPEKNLAKLEPTVRVILARFGPFDIALNGYSLFGGTGLFWDTVRGESGSPLQDLHARLVSGIEPLREGHILEQHAGFLTGKVDIGLARRQSLAHWGNPLAMGQYWPHITETSYPDPAHATATLETQQAQAKEWRFRATTVHITEIGPHGTCPGSLIEIALSA